MFEVILDEPELVEKDRYQWCSQRKRVLYYTGQGFNSTVDYLESKGLEITPKPRGGCLWIELDENRSILSYYRPIWFL